MADIKVQKVEKTEDRGLQVFQQVDEILARIQRHAYELFSSRGFANGHDLEDWIAAEHELCWPATELSERDKSYELSVGLPGFGGSNRSMTSMRLGVPPAIESGAMSWPATYTGPRLN